MSQNNGYVAASGTAQLKAVLLIVAAAVVVAVTKALLSRASTPIDQALQIIVALCVVMSISASWLGMILMRLAHRIRDEQRFPPLDFAVPVSTRVVTGMQALRQSRACLFLAFICHLIALLWIAVIWFAFNGL